MKPVRVAVWVLLSYSIYLSLAEERYEILPLIILTAVLVGVCFLGGKGDDD